PIAITDFTGHHLLGDASTPATPTWPIVLADTAIGWVRGDSPAAQNLAALATHLATKEAELKTMAAEVLDRYRELNLLYNLSEKLTTTLHLESVLNLTIEEARRLIDGDSGAVMLLNETGEQLQASVAFGPQSQVGQTNPLGQGIIGDVAASGKAEIINDVPADARYVSGNHGLKSLVCAPLKTTRHVIGVIWIGSSEPATYNAADLKLITTLALQAAPAIENAVLYEDKLQETRELARKNDALEQLDKFKDEFLANTSHELRTPLNGIIGLAESMLDGATGPATLEQQHSLSMTVASGRRLTNLVNDILDFSKLKHYDLALNISAVDMKVITDIVLALSKPLVNPARVSLINQIDSALPPVAGDQNRLQQIMHNLVGNAIKFTESGTITLSAVEREGLLEITVADTGIGIPNEKLDDIFRSFEQVDGSIERHYGGTGLGLSITKKLIELHGGTIRVESTVGVGSRFIFTMPISPKSLQKQTGSHTEIAKSQTHIEPQVVPSIKPLANNSNLTILVVDDEAINRQVLLNQLSVHNYFVVQAANGREALQTVQNIRPDLILLDVMMPRMSGYEVCQRLREQYSAAELPVVMLTAKNQVADLVAGFEAGANDYLPKPFSKSELLARIETHLRLSKVNASYARFVPHEILEFLGKKSIVEVQLGDQVEREMTILFSDIRSFTTLSEQMSPQESFSFINSFLGEAGPIIRKSNGFVDKYIGDAIMAIFPNKPDDAVRAAIAIRQQLAFHNRRRRKAGQRSIEVGIGIHTGTLMLGTIGESERMEGTVIADAVNIAARLEGLTKQYEVTIIISEDTHNRLESPDRFASTLLDSVTVKGRTNPISIYSLADDQPVGVDDAPNGWEAVEVPNGN
ncbi:MAG: response regulator, partial [Anaerolineae bacterium]|nr:response regulator [Anaerolineae bacterium]